MLQFLNFKRLSLIVVISFATGYITALINLSTAEKKKIIKEQKKIITQTEAHFCVAEKEKTKYVKVTPDCAYILNFDITDCLRADNK